MPPGPRAADETSAVAGPEGGRGGPANLVVLLLDSLNRHLLGCYGGTESETPNLDRFAADAPSASRRTSPARCRACRRATTSCAGARLPVAPGARSSCGRSPITARSAGRRDHDARVGPSPPLRDRGREPPHRLLGAWDYVRGHEGDPWRTFRDPTLGVPALPARGGGWFWRDRLGSAGALIGPTTARAPSSGEEDFPGRGRCARRPTGSAGRRRRRRRGAASCSSSTSSTPTSPSTRPAPWAGRYDPGWEGERLIWPPYDVGAVGGGRLSDSEGQHCGRNTAPNCP